MKKILVVGSLNMDMVIGVDQMPVAGETIQGHGLTYVPGGKGANQALAAARMGAQVSMLGCVGDDAFGRTQLKGLEEAGVDVSRVGVHPTLPTGTAVIYVNRECNNSIVIIAGANEACDIAYLKRMDSCFWESDIIMFQMEIPKQAVWYGIRRAHELGKTVIWNPAPAPEEHEVPDDIWEMIDFITPNETEALKLSGGGTYPGEVHGCDGYRGGDRAEREAKRAQSWMETSHGIWADAAEESEYVIREAAQHLRRKGIGHVLVTIGEKGVLMFNGRCAEVYPARRVHAEDTTAAGDCFNGALAAKLAEMPEPASTGISEDEETCLEEEIVFANVAASIAVTRKGAQVSIPSREEVESILADML